MPGGWHKLRGHTLFHREDAAFDAVDELGQQVVCIVIVHVGVERTLLREKVTEPIPEFVALRRVQFVHDRLPGPNVSGAESHRLAWLHGGEGA